MRSVRRFLKLVLASLVLCVTSYAQPILARSQKTFHVRGQISDSYTAIVGAEVKFEGSSTTETVSSDSRGIYRVELPVGTYSMTVTKGSAYYKRPLFRVSSPKTIILDVTLSRLVRSCDPGGMLVTRPDGTTETKTVGTPDDLRDECGGWDRFPIFSGEGGSFELFIRYDSRLRRDSERVYNSGFRNPVLFAFNLFTLTADHVTYDLASRTLLATGNVITTNGSAGSAHANSMKFRIANDSVLRLR
jgi:Carboxypeptidase regulatory-like domain